MKILSAFVLAAIVSLCSGCAGITGLVTGAFTGAVDLPAETYRQNATAFHDYPMLYGVDAIVVGPCGLAIGPVAGFVKGISLDLEWVCGQVKYGTVFGTYCEGSIWRPCTIRWSSGPMRVKVCQNPQVPEVAPSLPAQTAPPPVAPPAAGQ